MFVLYETSTFLKKISSDFQNDIVNTLPKLIALCVAHRYAWCKQTMYAVGEDNFMHFYAYYVRVFCIHGYATVNMA